MSAKKTAGGGGSPGLPPEVLPAIMESAVSRSQKAKQKKKKKYLGLHLPVLIAGLIFFIAIAAGSLYLFSFGGLQELQGLIQAPSDSPTSMPSSAPSVQPSTNPTAQPSPNPTMLPSSSPTLRPSTSPTMQPVTTTPTSLAPSLAPTPAAAASSPYVVVTFTSPGSTPTAANTAFANAAARWSAILSGTSVTPANVPAGTTFNAFSCSLENDVALPTTLVNQLHIAAEVTAIDGAGGILGAAGPCSGFLESLDTSDLFFPVLGQMKFDSADLASLEAAGQLEDVILHEMGHVLGIGTLWFGYASLGIPALVTNRIYPDQGNNPQPDNTPIYVGSGARSEYVTLSGLNEDIPIEDGSFRSLTPAQITAGDGLGSIDGHWLESLFSNELMTPAIGGSVNPLSILTIKALSDIGYIVDLTEADSYSIPAPAKGSPAAGSPAEGESLAVLTHDVFFCPDIQKGLEKAENRARARRRLGGPNHMNLLDG